jgi:hypothetical protein
MPSRVYPDGSDAATYRGLPSIYEFVNSDGDLRRFNCGQAAACSLLSFVGAIATDLDPANARSTMTAIEDRHPPDNLCGWLGTSRRRVERICRTHGVDVEEMSGEEALRDCLAAGRPVIAMLQTEGPSVWKWHAPAGHWVVAFGFDGRQVFATNWNGGIPWDEFRRRWNGLVPLLIGMRNRGLTAAVPSGR